MSHDPLCTRRHDYIKTLLKVPVTSSTKVGSVERLHLTGLGGSGVVSVIQLVQRSSEILATSGPGWGSFGGARYGMALQIAQGLPSLLATSFPAFGAENILSLEKTISLG